ncbi:uncharacterized protein K460DRAFT_420180 [Cucurbitaria berberidis CBS 394.84]|uniref:Uncharacterized protein n=1 Tax=Cucurbitaria berberidis CBS 394.84 TaxID=1168544 RepID=A0A9P4GAW8_9PLEO|nr:uncharacterized protein K460DRAFT_420180 [Cucurbitaria berberidis CBS 394.84]KAF1842252.1 hypothetical protein K460DRAFT_420180 [Cucurbitaria berberidis CBS 394.84]
MTTQNRQDIECASPSPKVNHSLENPLSPNLNVQKTNTSTSSNGKPEDPRLISPRSDYLLDWALKILGVAAALLFGIWAPISYKATAEGNRDNDASQSDISEKLSAMSEQASQAAAMQTSAASALAQVQKQLNNLGTLRVWEFCEGRTNQISACAALNSSSKVNNVVSQLLSLSPVVPEGSSRTPSTTADATSTATARPPGGGSPKGGNSTNLSPAILGAILGAVFGGVIIVSLVTTVLVLRRRRITQRTSEVLIRNM